MSETAIETEVNNESVVETTVDESKNVNEELVELRGVGRYFGADDTVTGPICRNCHERGHMAADCKVVICEKCGKRNDHFTQQCPTSLRCGNCGKIGHLRANCTSRAKYIYCPRCDSRNHTDDYCPLIWRSYVGLHGGRVERPEVYSCYNCGGTSHYGDDCPEPRPVMLRFVEDTAFSGSNLPPELQRDYFARNRRQRARSPPRGSYRGGPPPKGDFAPGRAPSGPRNQSQQRGGSFANRLGARISKVKKKFKRNR